jgi:hypothetical protein
MAAYTFVQLMEVLLFAAVLAYGVLSHHSWVTDVGGGLLAGKAILNILAPEGGTVLRRSLIGYGFGAAFAITAIVLEQLM